MKTSIFSFITLGALACTAWASPLNVEVELEATKSYTKNAGLEAELEVELDAHKLEVELELEAFNHELELEIEASHKKSAVEDVDIILASLYLEISSTNKDFNATCMNGCTRKHITSWSKELAGHCNKAVTKCKQLPIGHMFPNKEKCVSLLVRILVEINFTLKFLLGKCGLLGLLAGVVNLVAVLITALNLLLIQLGFLVGGLLASVKIALPELLGLVGCILCQLGLVLV